MNNHGENTTKKSFLRFYQDRIEDNEASYEHRCCKYLLTNCGISPRSFFSENKNIQKLSFDLLAKVYPAIPLRLVSAYKTCRDLHIDERFLLGNLFKPKVFLSTPPVRALLAAAQDHGSKAAVVFPYRGIRYGLAARFVSPSDFMPQDSLAIMASLCLANPEQAGLADNDCQRIILQPYTALVAFLAERSRFCN